MNAYGRMQQAEGLSDTIGSIQDHAFCFFVSGECFTAGTPVHVPDEAAAVLPAAWLGGPFGVSLVGLALLAASDAGATPRASRKRRLAAPRPKSNPKLRPWTSGGGPDDDPPDTPTSDVPATAAAAPVLRPLTRRHASRGRLPHRPRLASPRCGNAAHGKPPEGSRVTPPP